MKIFHIMKKGNQDTQFRTILLKSLTALNKQNQCENATIYLASGFFDEIVTSPRNPISTFQDNKVNNDIKTLLIGKKVELFGAYNGKTGVLAFGRSLKNAGTFINVFYKYRFHAKIFVIAINGKAVFEIIGSSNMTCAAYEGVSAYKGQTITSPNYECDLILMDDNYVNMEIKPNEDIMCFSYENSKNNGISLQVRMQEILRHIESLKEKNQLKDITSEL